MYLIFIDKGFIIILMKDLLVNGRQSEFVIRDGNIMLGKGD